MNEANTTTAAITPAASRLLFLSEVVERVRLSPSTIAREEKHDRFPRRIKLGPKRVAWDSGAVEGWIEDRRRAAGSMGNTPAPQTQGARAA